MSSLTSARTLTVLVLFVIGWLFVELLRHRRHLRRIPVRIHVNGTRGKSSVTRLVAAGLRGGGKRVVAKTTGTLARVLLPNARELPVFRPLGANIREQVRVMRLASLFDVEVLVVECMALQPMLQWLSERMFVQATHGVITNAREDHLDVMGPTGDDVARALCGMMPRGRRCFTSERKRVGILAFAAKDRQTELVEITEEDVAAVADEDMHGFQYFEHKENVALALRVCDSLGVDRESALRGMRGAAPDPGALMFFHLDYFGRELVFVNAFAANDPVSSAQIWEMCVRRFPEHRKVCVFNCRVDRSDRSRQLGESLTSWTRPDRIILVGTGTGFFGRAAAAAGVDVSGIVNAEGVAARAAFERIIELCGRRTLVVGLGNIGGLGLDLVRLFRNRARLETQEPT